MQTNPERGTEVGANYSATSTHANISYREYVNKNVVLLYVIFTATSDAGVANIDEVTLSNLKNPPLTDIVAITNHTASSSDVSPITIAQLKTNKALQLRGRLSNGRSGIVTFTYLI